MANVINELLIMYIVLFAGFVFSKKFEISKGTEQIISQLIINISLPALIFNSIVTDFNSEMINQYIVLFVAGFFVAISGLLISYTIGRFLLNVKEINVFSFLATFGNNIYLGAPICYALFGRQGFIMAIVFDLGMAIILWTVGIWMINQNTKSNQFSNSLKWLISPPLLSIISGILFSYNNILVPNAILETAELIGAITIPLAMLFIGFQLSKYNIKNIVFNKFYYYVSLVKLIIIPFVILLFLNHTGINQIIFGVIIIESGMPVFVNSSIILNKYAEKGELASVSVFVTTFIFLFTLPILIIFI